MHNLWLHKITFAWIATGWYILHMLKQRSPFAFRNERHYLPTTQWRSEWFLISLMSLPFSLNIQSIVLIKCTERWLCSWLNDSSKSSFLRFTLESFLIYRFSMYSIITLNCVSNMSPIRQNIEYIHCISRDDRSATRHFKGKQLAEMRYYSLISIYIPSLIVTAFHVFVFVRKCWWSDRQFD